MDEFETTNTLSFYASLLMSGPQLPEIRRRWRPILEMDTSEPLIRQIKDHLETLSFSSVYIKNNKLSYECMNLTTDEAIMHPTDYLYNTFNGLKSLIIYNTWYVKPAEDFAGIQKALAEKSLRSLEVTGILTDDLMSRMSIRSHSITKLTLHYQSLCTWKFANVLQTCLPNLEYFALRSSNLLAEHLDNFTWSRWPKLVGLDFENNGTLRGPLNVPASLKKLYLAFTHAFVETLPAGLEDYSTNTYFFELKKLTTIKRLRIHLLVFWNDDYSLDSFRDLTATSMSILFKDFFSEQCFSAVRKILPNCTVTKLKLLD